MRQQVQPKNWHNLKFQHSTHICFFLSALYPKQRKGVWFSDWELAESLLLTRHSPREISVLSETNFPFSGPRDPTMQDFLETITSGFKDVNKRLARLELSSANINEKLLRPEISKMFGENFSKQYTVNSLQGLVQLLSEANGLVMDREPSGIYFAAQKISQDLAVKGIAKQLLSDFYDVISSNIFWQLRIANS